MTVANDPWDEYGTPTKPLPPCPWCGENEIGAHFEQAWCCACGWRGSVHVVWQAMARSANQARVAS